MVQCMSMHINMETKKKIRNFYVFFYYKKTSVCFKFFLLKKKNLAENISIPTISDCHSTVIFMPGLCVQSDMDCNRGQCVHIVCG